MHSNEDPVQPKTSKKKKKIKGEKVFEKIVNRRKSRKKYGRPL